MEPKNLLSQVQHAARFGRVIAVKHARMRMADRGASAADVTRAIKTATSARAQPEPDTILLEGGVDTDGDALSVVVAFDPGGLRVVTVMGPCTRQAVCEHDWKPLPTWSARYRCCLCGAFGLRRAVVEHVPRAPGITPYRCARCGGPAVGKDVVSGRSARKEWRCTNHRASLAPRAASSRTPLAPNFFSEIGGEFPTDAPLVLEGADKQVHPAPAALGKEEKRHEQQPSNDSGPPGESDRRDREPPSECA